MASLIPTGTERLVKQKQAHGVGTRRYEAPQVQTCVCVCVCVCVITFIPFETMYKSISTLQTAAKQQTQPSFSSTESPACPVEVTVFMIAHPCIFDDKRRAFSRCVIHNIPFTATRVSY